MQPGQFLVNKDGEKRKILGVCGEVYFLSNTNNFDESTNNWFYTKKEIETSGWTPIEEPWVPKKGEKYFFVMSYGDIDSIVWRDTNEDKFRLSVGNVHRTTSDAKEYRQKLIEVMGRKNEWYDRYK